MVNIYLQKPYRVANPRFAESPTLSQDGGESDHEKPMDSPKGKTVQTFGGTYRSDFKNETRLARKFGATSKQAMMKSFQVADLNQFYLQLRTELDKRIESVNYQTTALEREKNLFSIYGSQTNFHQG